ncbi:MAG: Sec-independent protein translocase, TatC subunit [Actinomycetia bacterium]|nr:Sec-independent protein translocase, TatC subunit [Actinomycetes bacterium]
MRLPRFGRARTTANPDGAMSLVDHLAELRHRLFVALIALAVGMVFGFLLYHRVLDWLVHPYCDVKHSVDPGSSCRLVVTDPLESFSIRLKMSGYLGLLFASPVVLWQLWRFITPGLKDTEKRYAIPFIVSSIALFLMGAALAIATFPKTLEFFAAFGGNDLELLYTPTKYLGLLVLMMLIFGLGFEFPIILVFLEIAHVLKWQQLAKYRRYAVVGIFVVDAVITPSGDPITLLAMAVPMVLFYEISILIGRFGLRRGT